VSYDTFGESEERTITEHAPALIRSSAFREPAACCGMTTVADYTILSADVRNPASCLVFPFIKHGIRVSIICRIGVIEC
jgi:hypothetical protein